MKRTISLEKVNGAGIVSNARDGQFIRNSTDSTLVLLPPKRKIKSKFTDIFEHYSISIKPKLYRSNSLSDLTPDKSDLTLNFIRHTSKILLDRNPVDIFHGAIEHDRCKTHCANDHGDSALMSWNIKTKPFRRLMHATPPYELKTNMASQNLTSKLPTEYGERRRERDSDVIDANVTSSTDYSSVSADQDAAPSGQKGAAFPFKPTPSGNLKVQSNQVVFQSSTVGVLLADPSQAKVKVKFEGNGTNDLEGLNLNHDVTQFGCNQNSCPVNGERSERSQMKSAAVREDKGKTLSSLGYALGEPIDWLRVQLPKKQDLFQEFYRRIRNYINTDTIVHIGGEEFHCHRVVLQIYSTFFDNMNHHREIELPSNSVSPEAFHAIYEWMIFSGADSNKILKRDNVLDLFCAAQFLCIKDLEDQCWSFIVNENMFTEDSAFALFRQARLKGMTPVMELMVPRVMRFFLPLVASKDFLELEAEEVTIFLKSNYICVTSEIEVLMAGVRWLYENWPARKSLAVEIMRCVRFGLISPWQLVDIKRNPDNAEILEIVNEPEIQQLVDDGLAYVIIKYWYGNNSKNYYHWIDVLGLIEPAERNWIGEEKNHVTYKEFLKYLEQFMVPKDQMFQQMMMMQAHRRNDDVPSTNFEEQSIAIKDENGCDCDETKGKGGAKPTSKNVQNVNKSVKPDEFKGGLRNLDLQDRRLPKLDIPLPNTLKGLAGPDKPNFPASFPIMSEFFESSRQVKENVQFNSPPPSRNPPDVAVEQRRLDDIKHKDSLEQEQNRIQLENAKHKLHNLQQIRHQQIHQIQMCTVETDRQLSPGGTGGIRTAQTHDPPEKDSSEDMITTNSEEESCTAEDSAYTNYQRKPGDRHSVAASYLAAATAALSGPRRTSVYREDTVVPRCTIPSRITDPMSRHVVQQHTLNSPQISLFNQSKESLARINMNKLSTSILGPSNKNYITEGSLFNWDRETVLVFGGIDPHTTYGIGKNTGKDIYRFDPVLNVWEYVGDLPEPRHHHSVAFLRGRVYLVGGADPREDDIRGKSVVVSTVWSYEPVTKSWFSENGLAVPRKNFGLVVHRMALYAIGGQDKKGRVLRSVEKFDPKSGSWQEVRSMSVPRMALAAVKYRDYIWVAGGMTGEKKRPVCKIVECYNSKTNEWTEIHSLRFPRCFSSLFVMNDKLFIIGGAGKISEKDKTASSVGAIDVWDWKDRDWKLETEMSIPRHGHALAYLGTQLIIIGGVTTIYMRALSNVESFCCERGAWIRGVTPLPSPLSGHGSVTLPPASLM
ncbi:uncharacterized protein LOC113237250 isoform X2 [Hyposmocoma kahamanoa]|uniref:uncharacterized protein LOC113237250 isoform X2 n=1 Tax=Hyposmocoma kahamanoa TaxID=1477025 RepID=UPI000E6D64AA|nr:uncharacterized protein LOC113237250 isoform X2 [Hyposmocoma kahamanoa]